MGFLFTCIRDIMPTMKEVKQITFEEYKDKYTRPRNVKAIKGVMFLFEAAIGIVVATCLTLVVLRLFDIHEIAGYVGIGVAVLIFVLFFVVPLIKIHKSKSFIINVDETTGGSAKRANRKLREEIADKMIDMNARVKDVSWYDPALVGNLAIARHTNDNEKLKETLTELYNTNVKKVADKMIQDCAIKVGIITAISKSEKLDTMFVTLFELNLIKDLVYLYGFRPSEAKMSKIYFGVLKNALLAYGVSATSSNLATGVLTTVIGATSKLNGLIGALASVISSASQGVVNGVMTVVIGYQTMRYMMQEYKIQNILDGFEFENEADEEAMIAAVKKGISQGVKEEKANARRPHQKDKQIELDLLPQN